MPAHESLRTGGLRRRVFAAAFGLAPLVAWPRAAAQQQAPAPAPASAAPPALTVREARSLAARAIQLAKEAETVDLDYSPAGLEHIDRIVLNMRDEGTPAAAAAPVLLVLGCYVGEVLVRNTDGLWDEPTDAERQAGAAMPGIRGSSGRLWDPIGRVVRLFEDGGQESVAFFFAIVKRDVAEP